MPHICIRCSNVFESGEDILKGCPVCGWKKFMFVHGRPARGDSEPAERIITRAMGVRVPPKMRAERADAGERKKIEEERERRMPDERVGPKTTSPTFPEQSPTVAIALRPEAKIELNPQAKGEKLESIKITAPGTYELNLPTLFEREELIMAVKEGTYFIDLSSAFRKGKKD